MSSIQFGKYAVVDGVTYRAAFAEDDDVIGLIAVGESAPPGFGWERQFKAWYREVPRASASRLYEVKTWALYREVWPVYLWDWLGPDRVAADYLQGPDFPPEFEGVVPTDERGVPLTPPGFRRWEPGTPTSGAPYLHELSEPRSTVREIPLEPQPRTPPPPPKRRPKRRKRPPWADKT